MIEENPVMPADQTSPLIIPENNININSQSVFQIKN